MQRRQTWGWMAAMTLVVAMAGCHHPPNEQQVRQAISSGATAVEATNAGDLGDIVSDDFDGNGGTFNRRQLLGLMRLMRQRSEHLTVLMGPVSLEQRDKRYVVTFTVTLGSGNSRMLPDHLGVYQVTSAWRREDGGWRCYSAQWKHRM